MESELRDGLASGEGDGRAIRRLGPASAGRLLSDLTEDQRVTRLAAAPPQWIMVGMSVCLGAICSINGITSGWVSTPLLVAVVVLEFIMLMRYRQRKTVKAHPIGASGPVRLLVMVGWAGMLIAAITLTREHPLTWWMYLVIGAVVAVLSYLVVRWTWWNWARSERHGQSAG